MMTPEEIIRQQTEIATKQRALIDNVTSLIANFEKTLEHDRNERDEFSKRDIKSRENQKKETEQAKVQRQVERRQHYRMILTVDLLKDGDSLPARVHIAQTIAVADQIINAVLGEE